MNVTHEYTTVKGAYERLGTTRQTIYTLYKRGLLPAGTIHGTTRTLYLFPLVFLPSAYEMDSRPFERIVAPPASTIDAIQREIDWIDRAQLVKPLLVEHDLTEAQARDLFAKQDITTNMVGGYWLIHADDAARIVWPAHVSEWPRGKSKTRYDRRFEALNKEISGRITPERRQHLDTIGKDAFYDGMTALLDGATQRIYDAWRPTYGDVLGKSRNHVRFSLTPGQMLDFERIMRVYDLSIPEAIDFAIFATAHEKALTRADAVV